MAVRDRVNIKNTDDDPTSQPKDQGEGGEISRVGGHVENDGKDCSSCHADYSGIAFLEESGC